MTDTDVSISGNVATTGGDTEIDLYADVGESELVNVKEKNVFVEF